MKYWLIMIATIGLFILAFRPVPNLAEKDLASAKGIVTDIYEGAEGGENDIVIKLGGFDGFFYINRGTEQGLNTKKLKSELVSKEVTIKYPKHWTLLNPNNYTRSVSKIDHKGRVVYTLYK